MTTPTPTPTSTNTAVANQLANATFLKNSARYMMEAIGEGIKQSLNGMDINVEFMTLTARSLMQTSGVAAKKLIAKYNTASHHLADRRMSYHNNTTLSHS